MRVPLRLLAQLRLLMGKGQLAGFQSTAQPAAISTSMPGIPPVIGASHLAVAESSMIQVWQMLDAWSQLSSLASHPPPCMPCHGLRHNAQFEASVEDS